MGRHSSTPEMKLESMREQLAMRSALIKSEQKRRLEAQDRIAELEAALEEACRVGKAGIMQALSGRDGPTEAHQRLEELDPKSEGGE